MPELDHYDVIIIGSGAGGGTLAWKLAPSGKRILLLERGPYLPRERELYLAAIGPDYPHSKSSLGDSQPRPYPLAWNVR